MAHVWKERERETAKKQPVKQDILSTRDMQRKNIEPEAIT